MSRNVRASATNVTASTATSMVSTVAATTASTSPADIVTCFLSELVECAPRFERGKHLGLRAVRARAVEPLAGDLRRHVILRYPTLRRVVRIDVARAVPERLGAAVV